MAGLTKRKIDAAIREAVRTKKEQPRLWHDDPRGLHVRIKPSGVATFFIQYESPVTGRRVRHRIAQYGQISLDEAIKRARKEYGRITDNADPSLERKLAIADAKANVRTVAEFCDIYMNDAEKGLVTYRGRPKKPSTLAIDRGRVERHIKPLLGKKLVQAVSAADIEDFYHAVRLGKTAASVKTGKRGLARVTGGAVTAARTVDLLGSLFSYALKLGMRPDNPVSTFERPPTKRRDRTLSPEEYAALGKVLGEMEAEGRNPVAIAAIRALALTGCRRNEILALKCDEVDSHRQVLRLADTKTGQQLRPVGQAAMDLLRGAQTDFASRRDRDPENPSPYLLPASRGAGPLVGVKLFRQAVERAGLTDVTIHTLRHSFATIAGSLGYSELVVACLLGHARSTVTSRYAHVVIDRTLLSAADRVAESIHAAMTGSSTGKVIRFPEAAS